MCVERSGQSGRGRGGIWAGDFGAQGEREGGQAGWGGCGLGRMHELVTVDGEQREGGPENRLRSISRGRPGRPPEHTRPKHAFLAPLYASSRQKRKR